MMELVNALGWKCPKPLIETKRALDAMEQGTVCTIVDDEMALVNLTDYAVSQGFAVRHETDAGAWRVYTTKQEQAPPGARVGGLLMLVTGGPREGETETGAGLAAGSLLEALAGADPAPDTVIFMNGGVFWNAEDSPAAVTLLALEEAGTALISCGTCLDYYGVKEQLLAGKIGNMYDIAGRISRAAKVCHIR